MFLLESQIRTQRDATRSIRREGPSYRIHNNSGLKLVCMTIDRNEKEKCRDAYKILGSVVYFILKNMLVIDSIHLTLDAKWGQICKL